MQVVNPATGARIDDVATDDAAAVAAAVAAARTAQPEWAAWPVEARVDALRKFRAHLVYRQEDLAPLLTAETGKPITQANAELEAAVLRIDRLLVDGPPVLDSDIVNADVAGGLVEVVTRDPLGVVANISAWNYPYFVGINVLVPALLAGNAVVYKPSELATLTGRAIAEMAWGSGLPDGTFGLVVGGGDVGATLAGQPVDAVCFTGSNATGEKVAAAVAAAGAAPGRFSGRATALQLELGGKDPAYVVDDVDVAVAAASLAEGAMYNAGQSCCSVERIYVHRAVHDRFVEAFLATVDGFAVGDPTDPSTFIGPLTRAAQVDLLEAQVADAVDRGAVVRGGGHRLDGPGNWFAPTVLTEVSGDMAVMRDESFGPLIGIQAVDDDAEAVEHMADTTFGLTAAVYSTDEGRARAVLAQLDTGSSYWNCCDRVSPRLPWSGRRGSGVGVTLGADGIRAMTRPRAWHLRHR